MCRSRACVYRWLIVFQVALLVLAGAPASAAPLPQTPPTDAATSYEYAACAGAADRIALRTEIAQLIRIALENPAEPLDVDAIVATQWARLGVDAIIDGEVDRVVDHLLETEPWHRKAASAWGPPVAEGYAKLVAKRSFSSDVFKASMATLSRAVAEDISRSMTLEFERAASAGLRCLEEFAGAQYSSALYAEVMGNAVSDFTSGSPTSPPVPTPTGPVDSKTLLVLLLNILLPRLTREIGETLVGRIAGKIVERILGKGASSLLPIVGWVIGLGMLAFDLWESGKGALPQIGDALKSEEAKAQIRSEVTEAVKESLPDQVDAVAYQIAVTLVDQWDHFCDEFSGICRLQDENPTFANLIKGSRLEELGAIRELLSFYRMRLGESELTTAIGSYGFHEILERVLNFDASHPPVGIPGGNNTPPLERIPIIQMLIETRSTASAVAWVNLAGARLDRLMFYDIHLSTTPQAWQSEQLEFVLALPKGGDIEKVVALPTDQREILLSLPEDQITALLGVCQPESLAELTDQMLMPGSPPEAIAQGAMNDCRWEAPEQIPVIPPTSTPMPIATPPVAPTPPTPPPPPPWPPIDARWSIIAFLSICIVLEVGYIGWMFTGSDRRKKRVKPADDTSSEEPN